MSQDEMCEVCGRIDHPAYMCWRVGHLAKPEIPLRFVEIDGISYVRSDDLLKYLNLGLSQDIEILANLRKAIGSRLSG